MSQDASAKMQSDLQAKAAQIIALCDLVLATASEQDPALTQQVRDMRDFCAAMSELGAAKGWVPSPEALDQTLQVLHSDRAAQAQKAFEAASLKMGIDPAAFVTASPDERSALLQKLLEKNRERANFAALAEAQATRGVRY